MQRQEEQDNRPRSIIEGPKRLTIEEYKRRQLIAAESKLTAIPRTRPPKRRGGKLVRERKQLTALKEVFKSDNPPSWEVSQIIYEKIYQLEASIRERRNKNKESP